MVIGIVGNLNALAPRAYAVAIDVFYYDVKAVPSRPQGQSFPVDLRVLCGSRQQFGTNVSLNRVLEGLSNFSSQGGHPSEDVHRAPLHSIFIDESDVPVLQLDGDRNQD